MLKENYARFPLESLLRIAARLSLLRTYWLLGTEMARKSRHQNNKINFQNMRIWMRMLVFYFTSKNVFVCELNGIVHSFKKCSKTISFFVWPTKNGNERNKFLCGKLRMLEFQALKIKAFWFVDVDELSSKNLLVLKTMMRFWDLNSKSFSI